MAIPELGTLVDVNIREAWNHEAHSFTPWLAAHLNTLADKLGIPLELKGQEVAVDTFAADILAQNPLDESLILIENQLEGSDHSHLGQIMTYLAGLKAHTVVWVASDFRDAHLSALNWLNENTTDSFAFFAVKVKAVRIGNSPIAPVFEVMARPNHWERYLQTVAQASGELTDTGQFRKEFWTYYVNRFPDELQRGAAGGRSWRSRRIPEIDVVVVAYLSYQEVGVFIRRPQGYTEQELWDVLESNIVRFEQLAKTKFQTRSKDYFLVSSYSGDTHNRGQWDILCDWLHSTVDVYEAALKDIFEGQD
jgi:hypothetical protein